MSKLHVKAGDTVVILSGKDKGKKGKVLQVSPKEGKVIVEGCNMVSKHVKPRSRITARPPWKPRCGERCRRQWCSCG